MSNLGSRKISADDRILLFMIRIWRGDSFRRLGIEFGVSHGTANDYYNEMLNLWQDTLTQRLMFPWSRAQIEAMMPKKHKDVFPGVYVIFDATGFPFLNSENVLIHRVLYSAYHHGPEGQVVFGKWYHHGKRAARHCTG